MKKIVLLLLGALLSITITPSTLSIAPKQYGLQEIKEKSVVWLATVILQLPIHKIWYFKDNFFENVICRTNEHQRTFVEKWKN